MHLEFVSVERAGRSKCESAFDEHDGYTPHWWNRPIGDDPECRFIRILGDGVEVARVELDQKVGIAHYEGTPDLGDAALEIQFIEVSYEYRLQGIGAAVVSRLVELYPDRRLVAYSEQADEFWSKLGWQPYYHPVERGPSWRTLFIQQSE